MANTLTWYTDMNVPITSSSTIQEINKSFIWGLKALLCGQITGSHGINGAAPSSSYWTCVSSSDAVNATTSDLWGSSYNSSKLVYGANISNYADAGVPYSWAVLRSPSSISTSGYLYFLLLYSGGSSGDSYGQIGAYISNTPFLNGTITSRPVATNEVPLIYNVNSQMSLYLGPTSTGDYKLHLCRTDSGQFWFAASKNSTNKFGRLLGIGSVSEVRSPETQPWYVSVDYRQSDFSNQAINNLSNYNSYFVTVSRTHNNLYDTELNFLRPYTGIEYGDNSFDRETTNLQGTLDAFPLYYMYKPTSQAVATTSYGLKGKVTDVFVSGHIQGAVYPSSGDVEKVSIGCLWLPFDVAPQL